MDRIWYEFLHGHLAVERRIPRADDNPHGTSTPTYCSRLQRNSRQISNREEANVAHRRTHPNATL